MLFFDKLITLRLKEDGENILVTEANKKEYVKKLCHAKMISEIHAQTSCLLKGFLEIIPVDLLFLLDENELGLKFAGYSKVDGKIHFFILKLKLLHYISKSILIIQNEINKISFWNFLISKIKIQKKIFVYGNF